MLRYEKTFYTVMVNNNTNINNMNSTLLPQIIDEKKEPRHMMLEIHVLGCDRQHIVPW
jgi:NurA-like 5'-3' nuclease